MIYQYFLWWNCVLFHIILTRLHIEKWEEWEEQYICRNLGRLFVLFSFFSFLLFFFFVKLFLTGRIKIRLQNTEPVTDVKALTWAPLGNGRSKQHGIAAHANRFWGCKFSSSMSPCHVCIEDSLCGFVFRFTCVCCRICQTCSANLVAVHVSV